MAHSGFSSVLKNGGFRNLWLGQIVSQIGDYFAYLALTVIVSGFSSVVVAGLLIVNFLDHPYQRHVGGIQPTAMRQPLVMLRNLEPGLHLGCSQTGEPVLASVRGRPADTGGGPTGHRLRPRVSGS